MKLDDITVCVNVEDAPLEEYDVRCDEDKASTSCYVTSQTGKRFSISILNTMLDTHLNCVLYIDGSLADRHLIQPEADRSIKGVYVEQNVLRLFKFSTLEFTDNESAVTVATDGNALEHIGTLRCDFFRVTPLGATTREKHDIPAAMKGSMVLHEKTKKAGTHRVQLGESLTELECRREVRYIDPSTGIPFKSFLFRYRPKEMLQAQGIIPMPKPSSTNTNGKRPGPDQAGPSKRTRTDDDDPNAEGSNVKPEQDEELEDLLAARAAIEARIREAEGRRVKREASPIVLGAGSGEVIDLTLDD